MTRTYAVHYAHDSQVYYWEIVYWLNSRDTTPVVDFFREIFNLIDVVQKREWPVKFLEKFKLFSEETNRTGLKSFGSTKKYESTDEVDPRENGNRSSKFGSGFSEEELVQAMQEIGFSLFRPILNFEGPSPKPEEVRLL